MKNRPQFYALFGAAVLILGSTAASADDTVVPPSKAPSAHASPAAWTLLHIPTHLGMEPFLVEQPDGAASKATRDRSDEAIFNGGFAPEPVTGYELAARVVVRADDGGALALAAGVLTGNAAKVGPAGAPGNPLRGFWLVECASIAQAASVAAALRTRPEIIEAYVDVQQPFALRNTLPTDPGFASQWSLHNTTIAANDANLMPAWKAGFTGQNVIVAIVEQGWNITHPDLAAKFSTDASQVIAFSPDHGTSVAGIVGMIADNGIGGAGAAYGAGLSRLSIGTSAINAAAFGFRNDLNFVKNNSWGPPDNGVARKLTSVEAAAIEDAIANGRGGMGTIFVWAAGNGGTGVDRVDYDQYASNRRTVAVGAIDSQDRRSLYSEPGASLMLVAQSDYDLNSSGDVGVYSSSGVSGYTSTFGGSSASSPLGSGVVALLLEANPALTWRDVQHVLIRTARKCKPDDASWGFNGAGLNTSEQFGFGAIDAGAAVTLAQTWPPVAAEFVYDTGIIADGATIPDNNPIGLTRTVIVPASMRIESVELVLTSSHTRCGHLRVSLEGPSGVESLVAATRSDNANTYSTGYTFTSRRHFGERAMGSWTLRVSDGTLNFEAPLNSWQLRFYGTEVACPCDWDGDGDRDIPDIFAFLGSWFAGQADSDLSGENGVPDIFAYLGCWFGGCP